MEPNVAQPAKRKPWVVPAVVLVVVVALGAVYYFTQRDTAPARVAPAEVVRPSKTPEQTEAERKTQQEETLDTAREAIVSGNDDACARLPEGQEQVACRAYATIAKAQAAGDAELCAEITDEYWTSACADQVIFYRAVAEQKPSLCDGMTVKARIPPCKDQAAPR